MTKLKLERHARYQFFRTAALRLLFTAGPLAVLGGLWYWLSPGTFTVIQLPWSIITGILAAILVAVELLKWPLPKYRVLTDTDGTIEVLLQTKYVTRAREFLADYAREHGFPADVVTDVTFGRRG